MRRISLSCHAIDEPNEKYRIEGDLRLMVEANPLTFSIVRATSAATDGGQRNSNVQPAALHKRVGLVIGSNTQVERIATCHSEGK